MKKIFIIITFLIINFANTNFSFAQLQYEMVSYSGPSGNATTPLFNLGIFNQQFFTINYASFSRGFQDFFDFIIGISIATAVIVFMIAAFQAIISGNDVKELKDSQDKMWNAIVGLIIVLSTWLIINTINPDLLRLSMFQNLDQLKPNSMQTNTTDNNIQLKSN